MKDTTVLIVSELRLSVNSDLGLEFLAIVSGHINNLPNFELTTIGGNVKGFFASEAERLSILAW